MDYLEAQAEPLGSHLHSGSGLGLASSSSSVASRLYASGQQRNSRRNSFNSDSPETELISFNDVNDINNSFNDASNEISRMSQRMRELQDQQLAVAEEKSRLKTENAVLQERIHLYEEQLQNSEKNWSEKLNEEKHRLKDALARVMREKELEAEKDSLRYQVLEGELKAARREKDRVEEQMRDWQYKASSLRDQLNDLQTECERVEAEKRKIKSEFERYQIDTVDRMENNAEILEELTRQSDQIRTFPCQGSLTDQIMMLEDEIERLRIENRDLREQNKDMQAQILHDSVECGRSLLAAGGTAPSLAAELGGMDSQGLMNALREQELVNQRLRNYVNGILMRIIERHPDILEIKEDEEPPRPATVMNGGGLSDHSNGTTRNQSRSQPVTPPPSNATISAFRRSAGERLSLRFLWYGSSNNSNNNSASNNNDSISNSNGGVSRPSSKSIEDQTRNEKEEFGTMPQPTFAKRLYNSLVGQDWHLFGRQDTAKTEAEKQSGENSKNPGLSTKHSTFGSVSSVETVVEANRGGNSSPQEIPPPDPSPPVLESGKEKILAEKEGLREKVEKNGEENEKTAEIKKGGRQTLNSPPNCDFLSN